MEEGFFDTYGDEVAAAITFLVAVGVAFAVDRLVIARGTRAAVEISDRPVSRSAQTRLRLVRRLVFLGILLIGAALALGRFEGAERLATGILASSAVLGLVVGLAARQSIANLVAGVLIAIAQPIRIGDRIALAEVSGRVDDITLVYTYIDAGDGRLVVVPNETVVSSVIFNHSTGNPSAPVIASAWLPPSGNVPAARRALEEIAESVEVAEVTPDGVRLELRHALDGQRTRVGGEEAALREKAQDALRAAGLLEAESS